MDGDSLKDLVLTEARAMVIIEYLIENLGSDDLLKTLGTGRQPGAALGAGWGSIQIATFPAETTVPGVKPALAGSTSITEAGWPAKVTAEATQEP